MCQGACRLRVSGLGFSFGGPHVGDGACGWGTASLCVSLLVVALLSSGFLPFCPSARVWVGVLLWCLCIGLLFRVQVVLVWLGSVSELSLSI